MIPGGINPLLLGGGIPALVLPSDDFTAANGTLLNGRLTTPSGAHSWVSYGTYGGSLQIQNNAAYMPNMRHCGLIPNIGVENVDITFTITWPVNNIAAYIYAKAEYVGTPNFSMIPTNCVYIYFNTGYLIEKIRINNADSFSYNNNYNFGTIVANTPYTITLRIEDGTALVLKNGAEVAQARFSFSGLGLTATGIGFGSGGNGTSQPVFDNLVVTAL